MTKWTVAALAALLLAGCGGSEEKAATLDSVGLKRELMTWEAVKDVAISENGTSIWVGVIDNGNQRRGYAMSVCEAVREFNAAEGDFHVIRIIDVVQAARNDETVELGKYNCKT